MNVFLAAGNKGVMRVILGALSALAIVFAAIVAHAEEGIDIDVEGPDADLCRTAIEHEVASIDPPPRGKLKVQRPTSNSATLVYTSEDGRRIERTIELQNDPAEAREEIALVAASLMRDAPVHQLPAAEPPLPKEPIAEKPPTVETAHPKAMPGNGPVKAGVDSRGEVNPCRENIPLFPIGIDFVPYVGTSSSPSIRRSTRAVAFNALGGIGAGLTGFELGEVNIETHFACGFQLGSLANVVAGGVRGFQMAGALNVVTGPSRGLQIAGAVNIATERFTGVQIGSAGDVVWGDLTGAQVGTVNIVKGRARGVQMGAVNIAEKSDFALGAVNINTKGRTHIDLWSELEVGLLAAAIKHGGDHWHYFYGLGLRLTQPTLTPVFGVGGHVRFTKRFFLDLDALSYAFLALTDGTKTTELIQARPVFGVNIVPAFALYAGVSYNVLFARKPAVSWAPGYALAIGPTNDRTVFMWPGAILGVQVLSE